MSKDKKINTEEFERIKVENTQVVNTKIIRDIDQNNFNDATLSSLTKDELQYMLEFEDHTPEQVALIKKYLKLKSR